MKYIVTGGNSLRGKVELVGAKNAGFKAMIASLLANSPSKICGLGLVSEVDLAREIIISIGGKIDGELIDPKDINKCEIAGEFGLRSRSVTMYVGPLLKKFGKAVLPVPGGDKIGVRPIDRHIEGLECLGAKVEFKNGQFFVEAKGGLMGNKYKFKKNTHTGTETLLMCAVWAKGETILENAAEEPEVDNLIKLLNAMGGKIQRNGRTIKIIGVDNLHGAEHQVMKDRIEATTFACMALGTRGDVTVIGADEAVLTSFLEKYHQCGGMWEKTTEGIRFWFDKDLRATKVQTAPYPGFMTDWQPMWTALMTQAYGESEIVETIYEDRFGHIDDLVMMGAKIEKFRPNVSNPDKFYNFNTTDDGDGFHGIKIYGPQKLNGCEIKINDIRRGATVLLAGLMAQGQTIIYDDTDQIKRGYENLVARLVNLGAVIR